MNLSPNLFKRGLMILVVPIFCQLLFVAHLVFALNVIADIRKQESQSYELIRTAYTCFRETTEGIVSTGLAISLGRDTNPEQKRDKLMSITKRSNELADRIETDPLQKENAQGLRKATSILSGLLELLFPKTTADSWHVKEHEQDKTLIRSVTLQYLEALAKVVDVEEQRNAGETALANKNIDQLWIVFACAIVVSLAMAVILGRYYVASISKPLKHLRESGTLLSERQNLRTPMEGAVEFSQVDALLHLVAAEVEGALNREKDVVQNAGELICSLDRDEVFRVANPYVERLLAYRENDLIGRHLSEVAASAELLDAIDKMRTTVQSGSLTTFELRMRRKDGGSVDTKWSCVWSPAHEMFFCIVNDITEQKRAEQLKLDFSETVSEDLRSPLVAIQMSLNALTEGRLGNLPPEAALTLKKTSKNVDRLILLANELLDFQKIKGGKMQIEPVECDLNEIVAEAVDCISVTAEAKNIELQLPKGSFRLTCDRTKILQTVVNLLSNAIKFSPKDSAIKINLREGAQHIELQVIDFGPGIPENYQKRIFEPFEQVPSAQSKVGTGLGLAICRLIVETHGGTIAVTPVDGATGSIFTISLPKLMS